MKDSRFPTLLTTLILACLLSSCAPYRPASGRAAECNQLNSQMIFGGNTGNTREANIQNAEAPLIARNYDNECT